MFTTILFGAILIPIAIAFILSVGSRQVPDSVGLVDGCFTPCPASPNCVSSMAERADQRIEPIAIDGTIVDAVGVIRRVVDQLGGAVVSSDGNYVHAVFTSRLLRFKDDVEFLVAPEDGVIHVKSASRIGHSDLGVNRKRVETIRRIIR